MLGIADIADRLEMGRSTTHRYVITLMALGYLEQDASRKYRLGARCTDVGGSFLGATGLHTKSGPILEDLRRATSHTPMVGILDDAQVFCVNRARSYRAGESLLWLRLGIGARLPAHRTAVGKLLLAHLPKSQLEDAIGGALIQATPPMTLAVGAPTQPDQFAETTGLAEAPAKTTSKTALLRALRDISQQGYAVSDEEWLQGIREIAVPVRRRTGETGAAVGILALSAARSISDLVRDVRPQAEAAAAALADSLHDDDRAF